MANAEDERRLIPFKRALTDLVVQWYYERSTTAKGSDIFVIVPRPDFDEEFRSYLRPYWHIYSDSEYGKIDRLTIVFQPTGPDEIYDCLRHSRERDAIIDSALTYDDLCEQVIDAAERNLEHHGDSRHWIETLIAAMAEEGCFRD